MESHEWEKEKGSKKRSPIPMHSFPNRKEKGTFDNPKKKDRLQLIRERVEE